ncbi:MAG: lpxK [Phycisphaerales bacterium]|nr:lpxK [Phycisphaerales bacterium]
MNDSFEQYGLRVISGAERGVRAGLMRFGFGAVSPIYAMVMRGRNAKYDRGIGVRRLPRPVVSVGNMTTGGTGKTPVVRWLCERLRDAGERPAVLMRGYRARGGERGDEQAMLEGLLNREGVPPVIVRAEADRFAGGTAVLADYSEVGAFVMDDGFQHRRLARDFDLVLLDALEPFGFGRVLPRGLLREPLSGLRRADAILITRADQGGDVEAIVARVREFNATAPVFRCVHAHVGLRSSEDVLHRADALLGMRVFAFAGIGNPEGFGREFAGHVGHRWFGDHWDYDRDDLATIQAEAKQAGADVIVTTEKDWVKIGPLLNVGTGIPIWRAELAVRFEGEDEAALFELIRGRLKLGRT